MFEQGQIQEFLGRVGLDKMNKSSDFQRRNKYIKFYCEEDGPNDLYICNILRVINTLSGI